MQLDPKAAAIIVSMAECYWKLGKVDKSEDLLLEGIKLEPDDIEAREMLANQYIYRNQQNKAIEQFSILVDIAPEGNAKYIIALAKLTLAQNKINEAIAYFIKAYEIDPSRIDILEEAANLSLRSRQLDQARDLYKRLINIDKNNAYYLSTYIDLMVMRGDYDNGIIALESLIKLEGETTERLTQLGILYYKLGNSLKAKPLFEKLLKQSNFKKKQKLAQAVGIKISMRGKNRVQVEDVQSKAHDSSTLEGALPKLQGQYFRNKVAQAMQTVGRQDASGLQRKTIYKASDQMRKSTRAFQLHFDKVRDTETQGLIVKGLRQVMDKKDIFFVWDSKFAKRLTTFKEEEMGTVTGTHISGTGDDSSTVVVKKKKKKKDVHVRFKLKNQKSLKKRILDNVLAIQQKV